MSTGTKIIERALEAIGAHSTVSPAAPESIELGMEHLNSMLELWLSEGVQIGFTPLSVPGDELNETADSRTAIINNLAIELAPSFDNGDTVVSPELRGLARRQYRRMQALYQTTTIPKKVVSSTLPIGAGNSRGPNNKVFYGEGETITN